MACAKNTTSRRAIWACSLCATTWTPDEQGRGGMPEVENRDGRLVVRVYDPVIKSRPGVRGRIRWR